MVPREVRAHCSIVPLVAKRREDIGVQSLADLSNLSLTGLKGLRASSRAANGNSGRCQRQCGCAMVPKLVPVLVNRRTRTCERIGDGPAQVAELDGVLVLHDRSDGGCCANFSPEQVSGRNTGSRAFHDSI